MRLRHVVFGSLLILPALALASARAETGNGTGEPDCESASGWASRHYLLTPTARRDCVLALSGSKQQLRVSHLRRGAPAPELFAIPLEPTPRRDPTPVDEAGSRVDLTGSWSRWSYETKFVLGREARFDRGRLAPEARSELRLKSGLDLGIVHPGVELSEAISEAPQESARGFEARGESRSLSGGRAFVDLAIPGAPIVTLGVGREQMDLFRGQTLARERVDTDFVSGSLWYQRKRWQAYAVSSVYRFRDEMQPGARGSQLYYHFASASYWPTPTLTINPSVQYSDASYDGRQSWIHTFAANLGVYSTALGENGLLTLWSGYTRSYDTADAFDYQQLDFAIGAERAIAELAGFGGYGISVGGSVGYSHFIDRLQPSASGPGYRTLLTLRVSAAPECSAGSASRRSCSVRPGI